MFTKFTKTQALLIGTVFVLAILAFHVSTRMYPSLQGKYYPIQPKRKVGLEYGAYHSGSEGFASVAAECLGSVSGPYYFPQGKTIDDQCVEQCPAPTLPNDDGQCSNGL